MLTCPVRLYEVGSSFLTLPIFMLGSHVPLTYLLRLWLPGCVYTDILSRDNHPNFKLFFSLDLWAEGNALGGPSDPTLYHDLLQDFKGHGAYLQGPNGKRTSYSIAVSGACFDVQRSQLSVTLFVYSTNFYFRSIIHQYI